MLFLTVFIWTWWSIFLQSVVDTVTHWRQLEHTRLENQWKCTRFLTLWTGPDGMDISGPTMEKNGVEYLWIFEWKLFHGATFQGRLTGLHHCPSHFHPAIPTVQDFIHIAKSGRNRVKIDSNCKVLWFVDKSKKSAWCAGPALLPRYISTHQWMSKCLYFWELKFTRTLYWIEYIFKRK